MPTSVTAKAIVKATLDFRLEKRWSTEATIEQIERDAQEEICQIFRDLRSDLPTVREHAARKINERGLLVGADVEVVITRTEGK